MPSKSSFHTRRNNAVPFPSMWSTYRNLESTGISYNADVVKNFFSTLLHPLRDERHFALVEISAIPNLRLARNQFRSGISVRPMHLFGRNFNHDYYFELLAEEERAAQSITRCSAASLTMPTLSRTFFPHYSIRSEMSAISLW